MKTREATPRDSVGDDIELSVGKHLVGQSDVNSVENDRYLNNANTQMVHLLMEAELFGYLEDETENEQLRITDGLLERVVSPKTFWYELANVAERFAESEHKRFKVLQLNSGDNPYTSELSSFPGLKHNPNSNKVFGKYASKDEIFAFLSIVLAPNLEDNGPLQDCDDVVEQIKRGASCYFGWHDNSEQKVLNIINKTRHMAAANSLQPTDKTLSPETIGIIRTGRGEDISLDLIVQENEVLNIGGESTDVQKRIILCVTKRGSLQDQYREALEVPKILVNALRFKVLKEHSKK